MNQNQNNLEEGVMQAIKSGGVKMRPRWYFVWRDVLGVIAIIVILLIAVYIGSFIIFVLHQDGAWFVPVFGLSGWYALFNALPWTLVFLSAVFVVILAILAKRYPFGYKWPLIYSILAIGFLIVGVCFLFIQTSFYDALFNSAVSREIPVLGWYYPGIGFLGPGDIHRGTILADSADGFTMQGMNASIVFVSVASTTNIAPGTFFQSGDVVVVFGNETASGTIFAAGVERISQ
jgi:hypothetical protein